MKHHIQRSRLGHLSWAGILLAGGLISPPAWPGLFEDNFNTDPYASGMVTILDPAKWEPSGGFGGSGYISLTDAINDQTGSILIEDLDGGSPVGGFQARFKLRMGGGSGNAADGFSFNFATDLNGGTFGEEGQGTGLTVTFDIYDNGGGEAPAIDIKVGGVVLQSRKYAKADLLTGDEFADVRIEYRNGLLDVDFKGQAVYDDLPIGLGPLEGARFGLGGHTGGENNNHWIDNLRIETFALTVPAIASIRGTPDGFFLQLRDAPGAAVAANTITATFDGTAAPGSAVKSGEFTGFTFADGQLLESGTQHTVAFSYKYGAAATLVTHTVTITTPTYTVLKSSEAIPPNAINTSKGGFTWRIHQVDSATALPVSKDRALSQLSGQMGDNIADPYAVGGATGPAAEANPSTAPIEFTADLINFSQVEGSTFGSVTPDLGMPGVPGITGANDNMAAVAITALQFPSAGSYRLIVNSDDGFEVTSARSPADVFAKRVGYFEGGRGAADTSMDLYVESPGLYAFQTLWYEGSGDANIEWLSITPDGSRALLNDTASHAQAIKAYQLPPAAVPAYIKDVVPAPGSAPLALTRNVEITVVDAGTTVGRSGIVLKLNGAEVTTTVTQSAGTTKVVYNGGLLAGTAYTAELTYSDGTPRTVTWTFQSGFVNSPVFVIEGEDFDAHGQANPQAGTPGLDVDVMPYYGGAYMGLDADEGIDYNNGDGNDSDLYRTEVDENGENEVNVVVRNDLAGGNGLGGAPPINSSDRITYRTTDNYAIGWVGGGDWQNYTRGFPDNGTGGWWIVYAGLSYGSGTDPGQLSGTMDLVTAGVGTTEQTTERLGQFSAPGSGGWGNNNLVVMKTAGGEPAVVRLSGVKTLRFNMNSGDLDFIIFSPAPAPPPAVASIPEDSGTRTSVVLDWVLRDSDTRVKPSSVKVLFNNEDVTSRVTTTKTATGAAVHLDLSATTYNAGEYPWKLSFTDDGSPVQTVEATGTYLVVPYPGTGIFAIEGEDFNYSEDGVTGGKYNPLKGTEGSDVDVMPYLGGAYDGLSAVKGVDYNNSDGNDSDLYRTELDTNGENEVNIAASDGNRYSNERGSFQVTSNWRVGWVAAGDWLNFTRTFPQGTYQIWAAMSYDGRSAGLLNATLDLVTSDPTRLDQTTQRLGLFNAPGSGGWGRNELVPMKDDAGNIATVSMGGTQTVRFNLSSGDLDYLIFVPAADTAPRFTRFLLAEGGRVTLEWEGGGILQRADSLLGPWQDVPGATNRYEITPSGPQGFNRIRRAQ